MKAKFSEEKFEVNAEGIAQKIALQVGLLSLIFWYVFYRSHGSVLILGWPSLGAGMLYSSAILTLVFFSYGYIKGQKLQKKKLEFSGQQGWHLWFHTISLAVAYTIMVGLLTVSFAFLLSKSFIGLTLPPLPSAFLVGMYSALVTYLILNTALKLQTQNIVNAFTLFLLAGIFISMTTAPDQSWWTVNFSSLGGGNSISSKVFNLTFILCAFVMLSLSTHLFMDLQLVVSGNKQLANTKVNIIKSLFVFIAICLCGVGLFPWIEGTPSAILHNLSAYSMFIGFSVLIIGLKWLVPGFDKSFFLISYLILFGIFVCFILFQFVDYFNLTAFELTAFSLSFAWLIIFLRNVTLLKEVELNKK